MTELQVLLAVEHSSGYIDYIELLNLGKTDIDWSPVADKELVEKLIHDGILSGQTGAFKTISFGEGGLQRLIELEGRSPKTEKRTKKSQQVFKPNREKRANSGTYNREKKLELFIRFLIGCLIGSFLGRIILHFL